MSDLIDRRAAIDATWEEPSYTDPLNVLTEVRDRIKALPPAQPESLVNESRPLVKDTISRQAAIDAPAIKPEPQWIPCSERLPEEYGEYICTMENGQVQECGFVPENQRGLVDGWSTCEADGHKFLGYVDVLAWMPLPEPYKEEQDERR